ncbi:MAG TPA: TetR/AcrR family transcriptional regulator [Pseudonocardia sp.]|jgi:AcrR family transcriptional regulator
MAAGTSRAQRREQIRDDLLGLIEDMLDGGEAFADISVDRLAAAYGMSRGRFYLYFEDRNDLLTAWFGRIRAELTAAGERWWGGSAPRGRPQLTELVGHVLRTYRPHATLLAAVEEAAATDPAIRDAVEDFVAADTAGLRAHLERGQVAGRIDPELDAEIVARWLTMMAWRGRSHLVRRADDAEIQRLSASCAALLWNVLYAKRPAAG